RRLWPISVSANARRWIIENLSKGVIEEGRFQLSMAAPSGGAELVAERVDGAFRFSGLSVQYLKGLPPVEKVAGTGKVGLTRVDLEANAGELGQLRVQGAKIALTDFDRDVELASIDVTVSGPLREHLELVDRPPLGFVKAIGQTPGNFDGDATVRINFKFPLLDRLKVEEIDMAVTADVSKFGLRDVVLGQDARDGTLAMRLNNKGLDIRGALTVGQVAAEIEMVRNFQAGAPVIGETKARGVFSSADRAAFGFDLRPAVDGPVDVSLVYTERRGGRSQLAADMKLDAATLAIVDQDWSKPPGVPANARVEMRLENGRPVDLPLLRASGGGLQVNGRGVFAADGKALARIDVDTLKVGRTDVRGGFARGPQGISIDVEGKAFNGEPFLRDRGVGTARTRPTDGRPELRVVAKVDRLYLAPDRFFDQLSLDGFRSPRRWERIDLQAQTPVAGGASQPAAIDLKTDTAGRQTLYAHADNAGALLKIVGATPNVIGGKLELKGATDASIAEAPIVGRIEMKEFRLVNAPGLARILSIALLTGILDSLQGEGIGFTRLYGEFEAFDAEIKIRDARAYGSALGITAKGSLDPGSESVKLSGTLVPAYALNSVFGNIPLLGRILVPEKGGGLFAANYTISGPIADPEVSVQPLSTLAPGFLRGLFDLSEDGKGPPPSFEPDPNQRRDGQ
ncbi:MAG TPA: AsmA-like C-terminal region-containing protein, partial [Alphaproteobacteria bacterium]|nr:AsmA-like C-terminal region-containing protein [Alphaproteobacteria bacterium]